MRLHRFIREFDLSRELIVIKEKGLLNQLRNVFRYEVGDKVILCDGKSNEAIAEVLNLKKREVAFRILDRRRIPDSNIDISLYCSVLRKSNFELVVQKCTEIGVMKIVPFLARRTVKTNLKMGRLNKIAREAAEQSGRGTVPEIKEVRSLDEAMKQDESDKKIFFEFGGKAVREYDFDQDGSVSIYIGPEGGWDKGEIALFEKQDAEKLSLGKNTLRAETAAIVGSFVFVGLG